MAKTIAIVEDDPDQRANYADAITMKGYKVSAYGSRQERRRLIQEALTCPRMWHSSRDRTRHDGVVE